MCDLVIPLSNESLSDNDELRILLRSVERNFLDIDRVIVVTPDVPGWLKDCVVILHGDPYRDNKDANLFEKVKLAIDTLGIEGRFCLCADDNVFVRPVASEDIPLLFDYRPFSDFDSPGVWNSRMRHTIEWAASIGASLDHTYDCHAPQMFNASKIRAKFGSIPYKVQPGLCLYTAFRVISGEWDRGIDSRLFKSTHRDWESASAPPCMEFAGYVDDAFYGGLRNVLLKMFGSKSRYEK